MRIRSRHIAGLAIFMAAMSGCSDSGQPCPAQSESSAALRDSSDMIYNDRVVIRVDDRLVWQIEADGSDVARRMGVSSLTRTFPCAGAYEARTRAAGLHRYYTAMLGGTAVTKARMDISGFDGVEHVDVCPIPVVVGSVVPLEGEDVAVRSASDAVPFNDPRFGRQWNLLNDGSLPSSVKGCDINVVPLWERGTVGSPEVIVAVVDGGVDASHEDLADNMWEDPDYPSQGIHGYDFVNNSTVLVPDDHGTHVAGVIGAVNNNGKGVCGIAGGDALAGRKGVRIMSCQIFIGERAAGEAEAIKWAADHGAVICQNSWNCITPLPEYIRAAIDYFIRYAGFDSNGVQTGPMAGGLVVFSAGNDASDVSAPASYPPVVSVAALSSDFEAAHYTNFGPWVSISAPGGDDLKDFRNAMVLSTLPDNTYGLMNGTSMACPHVSGVAALLLSELGGPGFTPDMLKERLLEYVTPISRYNPGIEIGSGLLNATLAFYGPSASSPEQPTDISFSASSNNIHFCAGVPRDSTFGKAVSVNLLFSDRPFTDAADASLLSVDVSDLQVGERVCGVLSQLDFGTDYYVAMTATNLAHKSSPVDAVTGITTGSNNPPVVDFPAGEDIVLRDGEKVSLQFTAYDPDENHVCTVRLDHAERIVSLSQLDNDSYSLDISAPTGSEGAFAVNVIASDQYGAATIREISYTVVKNHTPVVASEIPPLVLDVNSTPISVDISGYFADSDGDELSAVYTSSSDAVVQVSGRFPELLMTGKSLGKASVDVTVSDPSGTFASQTFDVLVRDAGRLADIYPIPATTTLYVRPGTDMTIDCTVLSQTGATVLSARLTAGPFSPAGLDISGLSGGRYLIAVEGAGRSESCQFVKL